MFRLCPTINNRLNSASLSYTVFSPTTAPRFIVSIVLTLFVRLLWKPLGSDFTNSSDISSQLDTASTTFMLLSATFLFTIFTRSDDWSVRGCACVLNSCMTRLRSAVSRSLLVLRIPSSLCLVVTTMVTSSPVQGSNMMSNARLTRWHKGNESTQHATCSADRVNQTRPPFDFPYRM